MKEKIIHLLLIIFAGFLWCSVYFIMEKINIIECKTAKLEKQQDEIIKQQDEILYQVKDINETLNNWELID